MTLYFLFAKYTDKEIVDKLQELYENIHAESYQHAINEIRGLKPAIPEDSMVIRVQKVQEMFGDEEYFSVDGFRDDEGYGLEFEPWGYWLGLEVTYSDCNDLEALCYILWEMTFCGYSQEQIATERAALDESIKEAEEAIARGDLSGFINLEDLHEELEKLLEDDEE